MKTFFAIAALAVAAVNADSCPPTELSKLTGVIMGPEMKQCGADSGVALNPSALPSADQIAKMCTAKSCVAALGAVEATNPADCDVLPGVNVKKLVGDFKTACATATTPATSEKPSDNKPSQKPSDNKPSQKPADTKPSQKPADTKPTQKPALKGNC